MLAIPGKIDLNKRFNDWIFSIRVPPTYLIFKHFKCRHKIDDSVSVRYDTTEKGKLSSMKLKEAREFFVDILL